MDISFFNTSGFHDPWISSKIPAAEQQSGQVIVKMPAAPDHAAQPKLSAQSVPLKFDRFELTPPSGALNDSMAPTSPGADALGVVYNADGKTVTPGQWNTKGTYPASPNADNINNRADASEELDSLKNNGRCQTCENRSYKDGSNDPGVSFKTPTKISPNAAASAVRSHEAEHVAREQSKADREGRKVVSQTVQIHNSLCPECGKTYVSGGTTRTTTKGTYTPSGARPPESDGLNGTLLNAVA